MLKSILSFLLLGFFLSVSAQDTNPHPTRSRFWNNKLSTFSVSSGDILVYKLMLDTATYELIVNIKKYGDAINYSFEIPTTDKKGNVNMSKPAVAGATKYDTAFTIGNKTYKDKTSLWLSKQVYSDLYSARAALLNMGHGVDTLERQVTSTLKLKYYGKEKLVTIYKIVGQNDGYGHDFWVLSDPSNPLIVRMGGSSAITLKEVR